MTEERKIEGSVIESLLSKSGFSAETMFRLEDGDEIYVVAPVGEPLAAALTKRLNEHRGKRVRVTVRRKTGLLYEAVSAYRFLDD